MAITVIVAAISPARGSAEALLAGALSRGIFGWEAIGGYEHRLPWSRAGIPIDFPFRVEGHFATRKRVSNVVVSNYLLARLSIPGLEESDFAPYLAIGPGLHLQGSWSDLGDFGGVITQRETALKWHVLVGSILARTDRTDIFAEGRYTKPGPYEFDYLAIGLRLRGKTTSRATHP